MNHRTGRSSGRGHSRVSEANNLAGSIAPTDQTLTFTYPIGSIARGAILAIDLEEIRVWAVNNTQQVTACSRGVNGTVAASHAANTYVPVRPKFSPFRIFRAMNEELSDLSSPGNGLYQVASVDITYNAAVQGYDITGATNVIRILEARYKVPGPSLNYPMISAGNYSLQRQMPTTDFPSGFVFDLYQRAFPGLPIHLRYAAPFNQLVNLTDDVTAVSGLPLTARDILPLGAAIRLILPRELKRNFTEAGVEPRRAEEVPPRAVMQSAMGLQQLRAQRIRSEVMALNSQFPIMLASY